MRTIILAILFILAGLPNSLFGLHPNDDPAPVDKEIQQWIADWDNSSFSVRREASRCIRDAGKTAFPALVDAMRHGTPETVARAMELLKSSLEASDSSLHAAARQSLDQISAGPNSLAARSAQQVLSDFDRPPSQYAKNWRLGANVATRINTWTFNGTTTLEAFENDLRIKIQRELNGRIKVEFTQKKQGLDVTSKFEAANATELKTRHPAAYQAFQKYEPSLQQARIVAQRGRGLPGAPVPGNFPAPAAALPENARQQILQLHDLQIDALRRNIAQSPTPAVADALNRSLQQLIESRNRLQRESNRPNNR